MESIRLKDHLGMDRREAADLMEVSQPTFHRILSEARRKIGCAIVCGKAIRIHRGTYEMAMTHQRKFQCYSCQNIWGVLHGTERPPKLPELRKREHAQGRGRSRLCQIRKWQTWYTVRW